MANTHMGSWKTAARRLGISLELYLEKRAAGERHCSTCKTWKPVAAFHAGPRVTDCKPCIASPNYYARATDAEVLQMRHLRWNGRMTYRALAKMFGKSNSAIWHACNGYTKAKLPMPWERSK